MYVIKRDGSKSKVEFNKISSRLEKLCYGLNTKYVDPIEIAQEVIGGLYEGVSTKELDTLASEIAASHIPRHYDFNKLAARISISNFHKETTKQFSTVMRSLHAKGLLSDNFLKVLDENEDLINSTIIYDRDYRYSYFGFRTLMKSYLMKIDGNIVERPQHLLMRVSLGIHGEDVQSAIETYNMMSNGYFIHASPTLFNAGTKRAALSSCYLQGVEDSMEGIYETLKDSALISKNSGGIGIHVHDIRAKGSYIKGTGGRSNGIVPMLRVFNNTALYCDQGSRRPGAFAIYLEPWHADVFDFLELRKNQGKDELRARDLFYAMWINDLFMLRVQDDKDWTLMCPSECPGLSDVWGEEFNHLYEKYEKEGKGRETIKAQQLWKAIISSQLDNGTPYMLYKDSVNAKSNQQNLGTIKSSNLCTEITEYSSPDEVAVCNLSSVSLPSLVKDNSFDFKMLGAIIQRMTINLNKVIDVNYYPLEKAKKSNMRHRPIGMGVQGLADVFMMLKIPFESMEARNLNKQIFETIYYHALKQSMLLSEKLGPYETYYEGYNGRGPCPAALGLLQPDLWKLTTEDYITKNTLDWTGLRSDIAKHGLRNSLLVAPMPTASTAQILGNTESFDPLTSNIYSRRVLSGDFLIVNEHLIKDLESVGLWDKSGHMKDKIIKNEGSIQKISEIPDDIKAIYKTVWEIKQRAVIDLSADRGPFIDQSQSLNLFIGEPNYAKISSMHFYGWEKSLKTGMYYFRTLPAKEETFTISSNAIRAQDEKENDDDDKNSTEQISCSINNREACISCSG